MLARKKSSCNFIADILSAVSFISAGTLRRLARPILMRFWVQRPGSRGRAFSLGWTSLRILPTVFHPKYFGSSLIFERFVESLQLKGTRFLDMGTGSGIIGLCAARAGADVTAVDINPEAVRCAEENGAAAALQLRCLESDLFAALANERFDVIAWNPPFFPGAPRDLAEAAWFAGAGHSLIRRFAAEVRNHLSENGVLYLIFSATGGVDVVEPIFRGAGFSVKPALTQRWGLGETMVVFEIR